MRTDSEIQKDVMEQLKWSPFLIESEIGVGVKHGVVTLSGVVDNYAKKISAEKAVKKVKGVKAVAEEIIVRLFESFRKTDSEIAIAILDALKWHTNLDEERLMVKVEAGFVTLSGEVEWEFQRLATQKMIENLTGVIGISNKIKVVSKPVLADIKQKISAAFLRHATVDANKINIEVVGSKVILSGKVRSWTESKDAETTAWLAPGVEAIENHLEVVTEVL